ncbi:uncharacterized protein LOC135160039 [Diachasmimorpha longicaudata]|uniref:uncharacterized protein LOC135160039 n=1 Tax=Diachasmimorpha longicaudata TaxID=58733 RepID=UPI0030B8DB36
MKFLIGIVAVLAAFISQGEATFAEELNSTISKVHNIRSSLELYKTHIAEQEGTKFQVVIEDSQRQGILTIGAALTNWEDEKCKGILVSKVSLIVEMVDRILMKCFGDNLPRWNSYASQIDKLVTIGETIVSQGDMMKNYCSKVSTDLEQCLEDNLPYITNLAESYERAELQLRVKVQVDSGSGFIQTGACIQRSTDNIFTEIQESIDDKDVLQCLNVANTSNLMRSALFS